MAELTRDDDDDKVTAYRDAITTWVDSAGGRDLDRMAKGQLRDVAAKLAFSPNKGRDELRLPRRTRALGAGRLAACGRAAPPACGLAPLAFGFTRAAVVGILILGRWLAADL